jgi:hypothetical protein
MFSIPRRLRLAGAALLMSVAVVGCSDNNAPDDEAQVEFKNDTDREIWYAFYVACNDPGGWGPDRLGATEVIEPGEDRLFTLPGPGCWDLLAELDNGLEIALLDVDVELGERFEFEVREEDAVNARGTLTRTRTTGGVRVPKR